MTDGLKITIAPDLSHLHLEPYVLSELSEIVEGFPAGYNLSFSVGRETDGVGAHIRFNLGSKHFQINGFGSTPEFAIESVLNEFENKVYDMSTQKKIKRYGLRPLVLSQGSKMNSYLESLLDAYAMTPVRVTEGLDQVLDVNLSNIDFIICEWPGAGGILSQINILSRKTLTSRASSKESQGGKLPCILWLDSPHRSFRFSKGSRIVPVGILGVNYGLDEIKARFEKYLDHIVRIKQKGVRYAKENFIS